MSTGTNLRIIGDPIEEFFTFDKYGCLIASRDRLQVDKVAIKQRAELAADERLALQLRRKTYDTDVEFAYRPIGSTPVIGGGVKLFGPTPIRGLKFKGRIEARMDGAKSDLIKKCNRRSKRIDSWVRRKIDLVESIRPTNEQEELLKEVERDQVLTGGGYDNTDAFSITKSLLNFLVSTATSVDLKDTWRSELLIRQVKDLADRIHQQLGMPIGKLRVTSYLLVRYLQDTDGMIAWPVYAKSQMALGREVAKRISRNTGVSVMHLVDSTLKDPNTGHVREARVVDAVCYALDHMTLCAADMHAIIHTLARIQRHAYKLEHNDLKAKDGKSRSVSPNALIPGAIEAMTFTAFLDICKEKCVPWLPSLQDYNTQVRLIQDWYSKVLVPKKYRALAADWSKYDHTVDGSILATIIYYIIRPLYHPDDQKWVDLAIVALVYKYFIVSKTAGSANPELFSKVKEKLPWAEIDDEFIIVGTINGLGSGAKLTHVGGSLYGQVLIHHCIPAQLGYEGVDGPQAGDDTSLGIPMSMINLESCETTYQPIADAASEWGLQLNAGKQMWAVRDGEPVNIFLQYAYHNNLKIWGIGTAARYSVAIPFAERDKGLSIGEQYMAIISKVNNMHTSPFAVKFISDWLHDDHFIGSLFKLYGESAFDILVKSTGKDVVTLSKGLELEYNWGLSTEQLSSGNIPVLPLIAQAANDLSDVMSLEEMQSILRGVQEAAEYVKDDGPADPDDLVS